MLPQVDVTETEGLLRGDLYVRPGGQSTNLHPPQAQHTRTHAHTFDTILIGRWANRLRAVATAAAGELRRACAAGGED
jgi:hypothetical protein